MGTSIRMATPGHMSSRPSGGLPRSNPQGLIRRQSDHSSVSPADLLTRSAADIQTIRPILLYYRYAAGIVKPPDPLCLAREFLCIFVVQCVNTLRWSDAFHVAISSLSGHNCGRNRSTVHRWRVRRNFIMPMSPNLIFARAASCGASRKRRGCACTGSL